MPHQRPMQRLSPAAPRQHGVALFVVLVFVLLTMLLAVWGSRTSLFNELVVGNDADYQRAFEAAQALLQDAELDIREENPDGTPCSGSGDVCRKGITEQIPVEEKEVGELLSRLAQNTPTGCRNGLCVKRTGKVDFWNNKTASEGPTLAQMAQDGVGARYGRYTGAVPGSSGSPGNPILADTSAADKGGWYWIEVLPYDKSSETAGLIVDDSGNRKTFLRLSLEPVVIYRITALAYGRKPSTLVVLQQTYARQKLRD